MAAENSALPSQEYIIL